MDLDDKIFRALNEVLWEVQYEAEASILVKGIATLSEFITANEIDVVFFPDRAARPAALALQRYERNAGNEFSDKYFINPDGVKHVLPWTASDVFNQTYTSLKNRKEEAYLVFDTCMHSGDTMHTITSFLQEAGIRDTKTGSMTPPGSDVPSSHKPDFIAISNPEAPQCYAFGRVNRYPEELGVHKPSQKIVADRLENKQHRKDIISLRRGLIDMIDEYTA